MATLTPTPPPARATPEATRPTATILLVQDIPVASDLLAEALAADRFGVERAAAGAEATRRLAGAPVDVVLVDMALNGMTGLDLVTAIREGEPGDPWDPRLPIVALCRAGDAFMPVRAIERGADDALRVPFHYPELVARLSALLRRGDARRAPAAIAVGPLRIDRRSLVVTVRGRPLDLSAKEFALLEALAREPERVVPKQELLRDVWGYPGSVRSRTVDTHASRLRRKLAAADPGRRLIVNVWGLGYRLLPLGA